MYRYQKNGRYVAQVAGGLEKPAAREIEELGGREVRPGYRKVDFSADRAGLYRINACTRLVSRVLAPLIRFDCHSDRYLYTTAAKIAWSDFFGPDQCFAVFSNVSHSRIRHSRYAALKLKDAIVDRFRAHTGRRPSIDTRSPDVWIHLHLENNTATISLDTSGGSLHRRGYRQLTGPAPLQETLAAAIITYTGWDLKTPLLDPMCGSGTLLCEAFIRAARIPPAFLRSHFGFEHLPDFDPALWAEIRRKNEDTMHPVPQNLIQGSDQDPEAVRMARTNCANLPGGETIALHQARFQDSPGLEQGIIVCNPPYGRRLQAGEGISGLLREFGFFLRSRCPRSTAFVYLGDPDLHRHIPLSPAWTKALSNGGLAGCLAKYKIR